MKPIVLGTDGSPSAAKATSLAIELARETGARLYVVAAWQTPLTIYASSPVIAADDRDARRSNVQRRPRSRRSTLPGPTASTRSRSYETASPPR
jgi:nucleotide-binding universal stress UspA family protein